MNCKGCATVRLLECYEMDKCIIRNNAPKRNCPCETCLIKTTCFVQCDKFFDLIVSIFNMKPSYDYKNIDPTELESYYNSIIPYYRRL